MRSKFVEEKKKRRWSSKWVASYPLSIFCNGPQNISRFNKFIQDCYKHYSHFLFFRTLRKRWNLRWGRQKYLICNIASGCGWLTERCIGDWTRCRKDTNFPLTLLHKHHNFLAHILFNMIVVCVMRVKRPRDTTIAHQAYNIEYTWAIIKWKLTSKPVRSRNQQCDFFVHTSDSRLWKMMEKINFFCIYQLNKQGLLQLRD